MENNKPHLDKSETVRSSRSEKKKTSKEKPTEERSLRETWDDLLSGKDKNSQEKEKLKTDKAQTKDGEADKEVISDYRIDEVETVPLDRKTEKSIQLHPEEVTITEYGAPEGDTALEMLGVIEHSSKDALDKPKNWIDLDNPEEEPVSVELPTADIEPNNLQASPEQSTENTDNISKLQPKSESLPLAHYDQQFSYEDFIPVAELSRPELEQVAVNPNDTPSTTPEAETLTGALSTSVLAERLTQWRQDREIKKIKTKQRRHTRRLKRVKRLQHQNHQELSRYRLANEKNINHLKQGLTQRTANVEVAAAPNKAARLDKAALPEEAQKIVEKLRLPTEHRLEHSSWHTIEVDKKTGHAVEQPTAITYGSEFKHEQHQEAWNPDSEEVAIASGQLAVGTVGDIGLGTLSSAALNSTTEDGFSSIPPANPLEMTMRQSRFIGTKAADPVLWIILGVIIISIIVAIKG